MNIHEYQAKELFQAFGIPVPKGGLAQTQAQAVEVARSLDGPVWVVKAQVHAGGRGTAGGVRVCKSIEEVEEAAGAIIGMTLVTKQTGAQGKKVHKVWVEQGTNFTAELYLAVVLDRGQGLLTIMASPSGGMDIEAVAEATPEKIFTTRLDGNHHLWAFQARQLFFGCGLNPKQVGQGVKIVQALVRLAVEKDATQVEVNPLAETADGRIITVDSKFNFDDSAHYRQKQIFSYRDLSQVNPMELRAEKYGLNYVQLDGDVACLVNGAGLAMATCDVIKLAGGEPANFLDLGGGASEEAVTEGFVIISSNPKVKCILVNIFGGIVRCDMIAKGVINAVKKVGLKIPLVVRLEGTNVDEGKRLLKESGLAIIPAANLTEAGEKAVEAARGH